MALFFILDKILQYRWRKITFAGNAAESRLSGPEDRTAGFSVS